MGWAVERSASRTSENDLIWTMEDGTIIPVVDGVITYPAGMPQEDMDGFLAAYDATPKKENAIRWINNCQATYVSHTQIDNGNATNFPVSAQMIFRTNQGKDIRITVYEGTANDQGRSNTFEYQFDYKLLPQINNQAYSYLTAEGYRRFNYLPVDENYVLVETTVPYGFAKAPYRVIIVAAIPDVQHYAVDNEIHAIRISKVREDDTKALAGLQFYHYPA